MTATSVANYDERVSQWLRSVCGVRLLPNNNNSAEVEVLSELKDSQAVSPPRNCKRKVETLVKVDTEPAATKKSTKEAEAAGGKQSKEEAEAAMKSKNDTAMAKKATENSAAAQKVVVIISAIPDSDVLKVQCKACLGRHRAHTCGRPRKAKEAGDAGGSSGCPDGFFELADGLCGTAGCSQPDFHGGPCDSEVRHGPRKRKLLQSRPQPNEPAAKRASVSSHTTQRCFVYVESLP